MWIYFIVFFFVLILAYNANTTYKQQQYFFFSMSFLALFVGFSDMLGGYDRYIYCSLFDDIANNSINDLSELSIFTLYAKEIGYCLWNVLIVQITSNRYIYILLTTLLMYSMFYRALKHNTENPMIALVLFLALTFFFSFTYIRQMMAAAFVWQALRYVEKRNLKMFIFWVIVGFSFHNSAIIFFPVYFLPTRKLNKKTINTILIMCLLLGISGGALMFFDAYSSYDMERVSHSNYSVEKGFRWEYLAEAMFFYYFISKYYKYLGNDRKSVIGLNLAIIFCCILLVFIRSENGGRLGWFFMIGLYSIFSSIYSSKRFSAKPILIYSICFCLYLRIIINWGIMLSPYKTFLTSGVREGDYIEKKYEYDHRYDTDKFYR